MMEVRKVMSNNNIRHAPVLKDGKLVGILSLTDVQRMSFNSTYGEDEMGVDDAISDMFNAEMVMHKNPETLPVASTIKQATERFVSRDFHALPIVDGDELVGIVTTTDIMKYLLKVQ